MTKESEFVNHNTEENKRNSLEALDRAAAGTTRLHQLTYLSRR
jgi:hypothetical protein